MGHDEAFRPFFLTVHPPRRSDDGWIGEKDCTDDVFCATKTDTEEDAHINCALTKFESPFIAAFASYSSGTGTSSTTSKHN